MQGTYIDLFDDALGESEFPRRSNSTALRLHLRLHFILSIAFRSVPIIPEQWICSSPACVDVLGEIAEGYIRHTNFSKTPRTAPIPFHVATFQRKAGYEEQRLDRRLSCALIERMIYADRCRLTPTLFKKDSPARIELALEIGRATESGQDIPFSAVWAENIVAPLFDHQERARNLASLLSYSSLFPAGPSKLTYMVHNERMARLGDLIKRRSLEAAEAGNSDARDVANIIHSIEENGIKLFELAKMMKYVSDENFESGPLLQSIYRAAMHSSFASVVGAPVVNTTSRIYESGNIDPNRHGFAFLSIDDMDDIDLDTQENLIALSVQDLSQEKETRTGIYWPEFWRELFDSVSTRADIITENQLTQRINRTPRQAGEIVGGYIQNLTAKLNVIEANLSSNSVIELRSKSSNIACAIAGPPIAMLGAYLGAYPETLAGGILLAGAGALLGGYC